MKCIWPWLYYLTAIFAGALLGYATWSFYAWLAVVCR